jgi:hypothetical protein
MAYQGKRYALSCSLAARNLLFPGMNVSTPTLPLRLALLQARLQARPQARPQVWPQALFVALLLCCAFVSLPPAALADDGKTNAKPIEDTDSSFEKVEPKRPDQIEGAFGLTIGEPIPLNSKQVMGVGSPGAGLERYMLLFVPAPRSPYARYYATVEAATRRVVEILAITRPIGTEQQTWTAFNQQIAKLGERYGKGMRLGGGTIWKVARLGRAAELRVDPAGGLVQVTYSALRHVAE